MACLVNRVTQDGSHIEMKDGEVSHYECPRCQRIALWGWQLKQDRIPRT
jgi:hypothetical protein